MQPNTESRTWSLRQIIGDESGDVTEDDMVSALAFDSTGQHLAVGDNFGRIIVFEREHGNPNSEYQFVTELQAHSKTFDVLRSEFIYPKIVDLKWVPSLGTSLTFLTATEKSINLCKVGRSFKKVYTPCNSEALDGESLLIPQSTTETEATWDHTIMRTYPKLHNNIINSLSVMCNGINFISSDELSVFMWNLERGMKAYSLFELKHDDDEVTEIITSCTCNDMSENLILVSTNKYARMFDLRKPIVANRSDGKFEEAPTGKRNMFTDYLNFVSQAIFAGDNNVITREFMQTKVWDVRQTTKPLSVNILNVGLTSKLAEMYENDSILERFNIASSPDGKWHAAGQFNRSFHIVENDSQTNLMVNLSFKKKTYVKEIIKGVQPDPLPVPYNYEQKVQKLAWHPKEDLIACLLDSSIFIYKAEKPNHDSSNKKHK